MGEGMTTMTRKQVPAVLIRRRGALLGRLPVRDLERKITGGVLFASDRMSRDGKTWVRLDRDSKLRKLFSDEPRVIQPVRVAGNGDTSLLGGGQVMQAPDIDLRLIFVGTIIVTGIAVYFYYFHR